MKKFSVIAALAASPFVAGAQVTVANAGDFLALINSFINLALPLIVSLAVLVFVWGVFKYVSAGDDEDARKSGRALMINGVIAIFVMVSIWGLVNVLDNTFGLDDTNQDAPETLTVPALSI